MGESAWVGGWVGDQRHGQVVQRRRKSLDGGRLAQPLHWHHWPTPGVAPQHQAGNLKPVAVG